MTTPSGPNIPTPPGWTGGVFPPPRQAPPRRPRTAPGAGASGAQSKTRVNSKSFNPGLNINITSGSHNQTGTAGGNSSAQAGGGHQTLLPPPEFTSPASIREYCNHLRTVAVTASIEVAMGAEILKGVLATVPDPNGRIGGSRIRAARVARKLARSAEALRDAATNAAATYAMFQREYEEEIGRVRHRARPTPPRRLNWDQQ
ncbi:plasmid transfer protein TraA [Streptomyces sp. BI20]|uniref:plasmid transfer protein TraA n=1 Tax=Streptomyces sp. BI20 TaxID=3403460 RepID=UPI003C78C608